MQGMVSRKTEKATKSVHRYIRNDHHHGMVPVRHGGDFPYVRPGKFMTRLVGAGAELVRYHI